MSELLFLKCAACGTEFQSELDISRSSIDVFAGNDLPCPACDAPAAISEETVLFKS